MSYSGFKIVISNDSVAEKLTYQNLSLRSQVDALVFQVF